MKSTEDAGKACWIFKVSKLEDNIASSSTPGKLVEEVSEIKGQYIIIASRQ
jgi:hypothetical protein